MLAGKSLVDNWKFFVKLSCFWMALQLYALHFALFCFQESVHWYIGVCLVKDVMYLTSRGVQVILAYCWARPAILVRVDGECFYFFFFFTFISVPLSSLLLSFIYLFSFFSFSLGDDTK